MKEKSLIKIISGGQTGADRAGIDIAKKFGYATGGWMPKGWQAQDGPHPEFAQLYNMQEHSEYGYPPRTEANVKDSDATIRLFFKKDSAGEKCTLKYLKKHNKPWYDVDFSHMVYTLAFRNMTASTQCRDCVCWLQDGNYSILNIAGNSQRTDHRTYKFAFNFLSCVFSTYSAA